VALNKQDLDRLKEGQENLLRNGFPAPRPYRPRPLRVPVSRWIPGSRSPASSRFAKTWWTGV